MSDINREIQELLVDYAGALRDGCIPSFLKSLTREEARLIASTEQFWDATETVRILNGVGFADKAAIADVDLFMSRVDANIVSRSKKARALSQRKHTDRLTPQKRGNNRKRISPKTEKTEKQV
ncbi:MAG: hypothetical protein JW715_02375 [Sedimentisphaerales bacterium]|nr:hypothetical protein [Sedimentisphaerales bacterium]